MTSPLNHYRVPGLPVIACEYPAHPSRVDTTHAKLAVLADVQVARIVDLTTNNDKLAPYDSHLPLTDSAGARWAPTLERFPMPDGGAPPSMEAFDAFVERLASDVAAGTPIAIHCWGGVGRTGVVIAALLVRFGWPVEEALAEVNRQWRSTAKAAADRHASRTAPETDVQFRFVWEWARTYGSHAAPKRPAGRLGARQARACLLGGALGDALGAAVEFMDLRTIRAHFGVDGVTRPQPAYGVPSPITDDTQMTLFTAEGLLRFAHAARVGDPLPFETAMQHAYVRWYATQHGCGVHASHPALAAPRGRLLDEPALHSRRAPGNTCLAALREVVATSTPLAVAHNQSKGCGTVMRVAPIGLVAQTAAQAYDLACRASGITHGHRTGIVSGGAFAAVINALRDGASLPAAIAVGRALALADRGSEETVQAIDAAVALAASVAPAPPTPEQLLTLGEGWVAEEALSIALCCALTHPDHFVAATCLAANLVRGDSDSTASMTGQLMGLLVGLEGLPADWLDALELSACITAVADDLALGACSARVA